ncbi:MAG: lytic transglycosylase, partial [Pseudomonadota bacterium]|nr:lytic transglycosylase [Pseudomonadota bacterium]MEC8573140.1 lytic transglycosylase [Pseudomonadota bacterium]
HDGHTGFARGTYRSKPWLIRIAGQVQARANMYQTQLATCRQARR